MTPSTALTALLFGLCVQHASPGWAQTTPAPKSGRIEVAAALLWTGATTVGVRDATLTAADGSRFRLFSTSSELASAAGVDLRIGARLARLVDGEVVASYSSRRLTTSVTGDIENGAPTTASEPTRQIAIQGAAVLYLPRRPGARFVPFATAGGGFLQQVHERQTLVQRGGVYHVGGGIKVPLGSRAAAPARVKQVGVRVDARALVRTTGVTLDDRAHIGPEIAAGLFVRF